MFRLLPRNTGNESSEQSSPSRQKETKPINIDARSRIYSVAFLSNGKHIVSGDDEGKLRRWRVKDGKEVGVPMNAGSPIRNIAVSQDDEWLVSGTKSGLVTVWRTKNHAKATELKGHTIPVRAVDVSSDGTKIATGSFDRTVRVWSRSTGKELFRWKHDYWVVAVKFSPDGQLIATATWGRGHSIRIYNSEKGDLLRSNVPIEVNSRLNQSLAWDSSSKQLFVLSSDTNIYSLDVSIGATLSQWSIHSGSTPRCISLAATNTFIATSNGSSVSFWDTMTHQQIGPVFQPTSDIGCMAISPNHDLAVGGDNMITLRSLGDILPSSYLDGIPAEHDPDEATESLSAHQESSSTLSGVSNLIHGSPAALELWRSDKLLNAIDILSQEMKLATKREHLLASRAMLQARLRRWGPAIQDARKSIAIKPTILAYIAISIAQFGRGDRDRAKKLFNLLFCRCDVDDFCFMSLIKAIIIFTSGNYKEGVARVADLMLVCPEADAALYHAVQAHMYMIAGKAYMGKGQYDMVLNLFTNMRGCQLPHFPNHPQFECILLLFGWTHDSDGLRFTLYQQQCEALYALQRQEEAAKLLRIATRDLGGKPEANKEVREWLREFAQQLRPSTNVVAGGSTASPTSGSSKP